MTTPTKPEVIALYNGLLAHAKVHTDSQGNGNDDPELHAFNGLRSEVHFLLQQDAPVPAAEPGEDADDVHHKQKMHFKNLWKATDALIASAGVTEKGLVS